LERELSEKEDGDALGQCIVEDILRELREWIIDCQSYNEYFL
jgi:hypothetical protein